MRLIAFAPLALISCVQDYDLSAQPPVVNPEDVTECGFTAVEGTDFKRYDCNPVFTDTNEEWSDGIRSTGFHAEVVMGHPFYQMWYTANASTVGNYDLGYAISADGTNWEPLDTNPLLTIETPTWRRDGMDGITVVWDSDASRYAMTYQGLNLNTGDNGLGIMTSEDGQRWIAANADQPIIDLSTSVNGVSYCWPLALAHKPGDGFQGYIAGGPPGAQTCQIYGYSGASVETMEPDATPILQAGPDPWDQRGMVGAAVVQLDDTWYMFYSGIQRWEEIPGTNFIAATNTTFNMATSSDGINWVKSPDNPLRDIGLVSNPAQVGKIAAQVVGPRIHLWIDDVYPELDARATGYFLYEPSAP